MKLGRICKNITTGAALAALALSQLQMLYLGQAQAAEVGFIDFPFLIHCETSGIEHAFYLSKIGQDGVAVYVSPDNKAGTITITGIAKPIGTVGAGNCSSKTLEQLRSAGQSYYLQ